MVLRQAGNRLAPRTRLRVKQNRLPAGAIHRVGLRLHEQRWKNAATAVTISLRRWPRKSETEVAVRAKAHQIKMVGVRFTVDQDEIWSDVTIPMVLPWPGQRVIMVTPVKHPIGHQFGKDVIEFRIKDSGEAAFLFAPVVPLVGCRSPNRPH